MLVDLFLFIKKIPHIAFHSEEKMIEFLIHIGFQVIFLVTSQQYTISTELQCTSKWSKYIEYVTNLKLNKYKVFITNHLTTCI